MATYRKRGETWTACVRRKGVSEYKTFQTKASAMAWATQTELDIQNGHAGQIPDKTFGQLMERYRDEVTVKKKGERSERMKIDKLLREDALAKVKLKDLDERDIAAWRDRRMESIQGSSVNREWCILSNACTIAINEWKWLIKHPMKTVRHPAGNDHRERVASDDEIERILFVLGDELKQVNGRVGMVVRFALETAMRAGEIAGLTWDRVVLDEKLCKTFGKTQAAKRDVPLSKEAIRIIESMSREADTVFNVSTAQLDALYRKARDKAAIEGLTFHDLRHTAITRIAKQMSVLPLAKMIGHKDLKKLMIYYNPSATELAELLG
jgi:integrase